MQNRNSIFFFIITSLFLFHGCENSQSLKSIKVDNNKELQAALSEAKAGDHIIMANGIWEDVQIKIKKSGTSAHPIRLSAESSSEVMIQGKSNLELNTTMSLENVFQIGSITKQFTAVSILMLAEQGKLNLEDGIETYIKNFPTKGKKITIHQLLNHTSGIKNSTPVGDNGFLSRKDMTSIELVDVTGVSATSGVGSIITEVVYELSGQAVTTSAGSITPPDIVQGLVTDELTSTAGIIGIQAYANIDTGSNTSYTSVATGSNTSYSNV